MKKLNKKILTGVEIAGHEELFTVMFDGEIFTAKQEGGEKTIKYKMVKSFNRIKKEYRDEILIYRLGKTTATDVVIPSDVFLHGKYIKEI
jgi:phosphotransferase system IIA component